MVLTLEPEYSVPSGANVNAFTVAHLVRRFSVLTYLHSVVFHTLMVPSSETEYSVPSGPSASARTVAV